MAHRRTDPRPHRPALALLQGHPGTLRRRRPHRRMARRVNPGRSIRWAKKIGRWKRNFAACSGSWAHSSREHRSQSSLFRCIRHSDPSVLARGPRQCIAPGTDNLSPEQGIAKQPRGHAAAWTILSLGLAVFACGAMLLAWSLVGQREDLWPVGMPLALIGQAGLVLGLILQLDGLWNSSRKTEQALERTGRRTKDRAARHDAVVHVAFRSAARSFYLHLAEGASRSFCWPISKVRWTCSPSRWRGRRND